MERMAFNKRIIEYLNEFISFITKFVEIWEQYWSARTPKTPTIP